MNNIILNFHDLISDSIEIKASQDNRCRISVEAKNCQLQTCFFNVERNDADRKIFTARKLTYASSPKNLNTDEGENWQQVSEFNSIKIEGLKEKEEDEHELLTTKYKADFDNSYFCVRKMDITSACSSQLFKAEVLYQYPNTVFTFDISNGVRDSQNGGIDESIIDEYSEDTQFGIISTGSKYREIEPILEKFAKKNIVSVEIDLPKSDRSNEVVAVQSLHKIIQENNTLIELEISLHEQASIISILDSCENKPDIDNIKIACSQDLSKQVKTHVQEYKKRNIFKSIKIFISEVKQKKSGCIIF